MDQLFKLLGQEKLRQKKGINLIASENYASKDIMEMVGSCLMNKYVEGIAGARYYSGFEFIDPMEQIVIDRFKKLFGAEHANVQPHSGTQANMAIYNAFLKPGNTILSMNLSAGGHLSHGHKVSMIGSLYNIISYGVDKKTELIDYDAVEKLATESKPKLIIAGASSYSREIDFNRFSKIAKKVGAYLLADIAHTAGLIAVNLQQSPVGFADFITMTTHKSFRGPRGAVILCKEEYAKKIDHSVMPGVQGGAFMNNIAAKGIAAAEAMTNNFVEYQEQVIKNAKLMANQFKKLGYKVISDGTDSHMFMLDLGHLQISGKEAEAALEKVNLFVNRNMIPFDKRSPLDPSGIRIGLLAITTLGAKETDVIKITQFIDKVLTRFSKFSKETSFEGFIDESEEIVKNFIDFDF